MLRMFQLSRKLGRSYSPKGPLRIVGRSGLLPVTVHTKRLCGDTSVPDALIKVVNAGTGQAGRCAGNRYPHYRKQIFSISSKVTSSGRLS